MGCFLTLFVGQTLAAGGVAWLTVRHLKRCGEEVLPSFEGFVDPSTFARITAYTAAKNRTAIVRETLSDLALLTMILSGFLISVEKALLGWNLHFVSAGIVFFMVPGLILSLLSLPFDYYCAFGIEEAFGFNRSSLGTWVADRIKSGVLSLILSSVLIAALLWTNHVSPEYWWWWAFAIVSSIQIGLTVAYPILIAPLFNKFEPVKDEDLSHRIRALMEDNGIRIDNLFQMDAGTRSRHTNAYFSGLGKTKRIVLYDTLLESHSHEEILSILAHEVGHLQGRHVFKLVLIFELSLLAGLFVSYRLLEWPLLYSTFGFSTPEPWVGLFLILLIWERGGYFLRPLYMGLSRRFELEADLFAARLMKTSVHLVASLKRMAADNLSNPAPHPLDVCMNYSHPPLVERIERLVRAEPDLQGAHTYGPSPLHRESGTC